jgi:hypothetical protein
VSSWSPIGASNGGQYMSKISPLPLPMPGAGGSDPDSFNRDRYH